MMQKKIELAYLCCLLFIFGVQSYFMFTTFIPNTLETYALAPEIQAHVRGVITVFSNLVSTWFLLAVVSPLARLINIFIGERRAKQSS